jgi:catechol 2,3-dioxygenase-like lactoylglutathione lyase family enzyme
MAIQYLMHFGVCVRDLERSIRFYRDALGFTEASRLQIEGDPTATMLGLSELELHGIYLDRDGFRIELLHYPRPGTVGPAEARPMNQPGLTHMALRVDDLDETIRAVEDHGGHLIESSRVYNPSFDAHLAYVTDPDGTRLELVQVPKDPTR